MATELQELRDLVQQLRAEKEQLLQEQLAANSLPSDSDPGRPTDSQNSVSNNPLPIERLFYIPRERKCPTFRGTSGIPVEDWNEEMRATLRARQLRPIDQAYFIYDHLEGEAKDEIRYRPKAEREDPERIFAILQDLYGCPKSYVSLQQSVFSRRQLDGESLQEFSHALCCLVEKVDRCAPRGMRVSPTLLRDQFVEHVFDTDLRRELKRVVRQHPDYTLLDVRAEAIRWEREGRPDEPRGRSFSVPSFSSMQVSESRPPSSSNLEMMELKQMLQKQQEQLNQLTQGLMALQASSRHPVNHKHLDSVICRRFRKPGHYARECHSQRVVSQVAQQPRPPHPTSATSVAQDVGNFSPLM